MKKVLNLGAGNKDYNGFINVDKTKGKYTDKVWDLNVFPYPFKSDSVDYVLMEHTLEHLDNPIKVIGECYKILKEGSVLKIILPHFSSSGAYTPFHKTYWSSGVFNHFNNTASNGDDKKWFDIIKINIKFTKGLAFWNYILEYLINNNKKLFNIYESHLCWIFPAKELICELKKK